jgi:hypothetical protein
MTQQPTAAGALYPHLKSGTPDVVERRREPNSVADAVYSHLRPTPPRPAWQERYRQSLLDGLRQMTSK